MKTKVRSWRAQRNIRSVIRMTKIGPYRITQTVTTESTGGAANKSVIVGRAFDVYNPSTVALTIAPTSSQTGYSVLAGTHSDFLLIAASSSQYWFSCAATSAQIVLTFLE